MVIEEEWWITGIEDVERGKIYVYGFYIHSPMELFQYIYCIAQYQFTMT